MSRSASIKVGLHQSNAFVVKTKVERGVNVSYQLGALPLVAVKRSSD